MLAIRIKLGLEPGIFDGGVLATQAEHFIDE